MNRHRKNGSGLFAVLIIATALGIGIYSTLSLVDGEFRRNKKAAAYHEAKQAAESLLQTGMADLKKRFDSKSAFPTDALSPSESPLSISDEFASIHSSPNSLSHVVIPEIRKYTSESQFNTQDTEIIGGQVPPGRWVYIDPDVPGNSTDPLNGTRVHERSIEMISKATVDYPNVGRSSVHARQILQIRDAPLFAYAIFYNLPLEIAPGAQMDILGGGIHGNKGGWFQSNNGLNIHTKVSFVEGMYHGRHPDSGKTNSNGSVKIINGQDELVSLKKDSSTAWDESEAAQALPDGTWLTSSLTNFSQIFDQLFGGNVQPTTHVQNPVGVTEFDPNSNVAYNFVQPVLDASDLVVPDAATDPVGHARAQSLNAIETQKYAYKAGLTIEVSPTGNVSYYRYDRDFSADPEFGALKYDGAGHPVKVPLVPSEPIADYKAFTEVSGVITGGLIDVRQGQELDILEIDVGKLKDLLHAPNHGKDTFGVDNEQQPDKWWNGVVYVKFPQENGTVRDDHVNPALPGKGVKLVNGRTIPNPGFAVAEENYGMSLATNQMLYVKGDYNADGVMGANTDSGTGSPTAPDKPADFAKVGEEAPAALIADSVTFLSNSWNDTNSGSALSSRVASNTEISAAILTGIVPSRSNNYSGGVENFPRLLEKWSGKTLRIRGSMVALFESEVGSANWNGDAYGAANRAWGFHEKFALGYLPPGTPNTRQYRAIDFELISSNEYANDVEKFKTYY